MDYLWWPICPRLRGVSWLGTFRAKTRNVLWKWWFLSKLTGIGVVKLVGLEIKLDRLLEDNCWSCSIYLKMSKIKKKITWPILHFMWENEMDFTSHWWEISWKHGVWIVFRTENWVWNILIIQDNAMIILSGNLVLVCKTMK